MQKIISCVLSFTLIFMSVAPSLAGVTIRRPVAKKVRSAMRETPREPIKRETVTTPRHTTPAVRPTTPRAEGRVSATTPTQSPRTSSVGSAASKGRTTLNATQTQRVVFNNARTSLHTTYGSLLPQGGTILDHANLAEQRLMMLADFPINVLNKTVSPADLTKGLEFYRKNLESVKFDALPQSLASAPQAVEALAETAVNISSLGLIGVAEHDAPILFELYQKSVGTAAEPLITTVTSHALLRLEAYKELSKMSEISSIAPELWDGISSYAKANKLTLTIAKKQRTAVDMGPFQGALEKYGDLPSCAARLDEFSTFRYANAGKTVSGDMEGRLAQGDMEGQFSIVDPATENASRELYASAGAPVAHTGKVQPVMQAPIEHAVAEEPAVAQQAAVNPNPQYIQTTVTNKLGQEVQSWKENPDYVGPKTTPSTGKNFSIWDRIRVDAASTLVGLRMFVTSRYGWMGLFPGAAPLTAEAAVHEAPAMEMVEHVRTAQNDFISLEEFNAGPGASARTGTPNTGGMVAQQAAERTVRENAKVKTQTPATSSVSPSVTNAASKARAVTMGGKSTSGIAASSLIPMPRSWLYKLTGATGASSSSLRKQADKQALEILNLGAPLPTRLVAILQSEASENVKGEALVRLYKMGKLNDILQQSLTPAALNAVIELGRQENTINLGKRLYSLYTEQLISDGVNAISDAVEQDIWNSELMDVVGAPGFSSQARALAEATEQMPIMSAEDIGTNTYIAPDADLKRIYSAFRTDSNFVQEHMQGTERGDVIHYDKHIPFYYRDSNGNLSESPVGVLTQIQASKYGKLLSRIPYWLKFPNWKKPRSWFKRSSWGVKYMADDSGFDIPKGFVLALDENGQWKFVKQNRELAESNPLSAALLAKIETEGSVKVGLATPYSTTDMLAIAKMLEIKTQAQKAGKLTTPLTFELELNAADSLKQMLTLWGLYIGLDSGASVAGLYKGAISSVEGAPVNAVGNLVPGQGYASPGVAAAMAGYLRDWGVKASMYGLFAIAALGLGISLGVFHMTGFENPETLGLWKPALPLATAIFTGSLFGLLQPVVLATIYKDPLARHEANLEFASTKQLSRMVLTGLTFLFGLKALGGLSWTIAIPFAFTLLGMTFMLFMNTPLVRSSSGIAVTDKTALNLLAKVPEENKKDEISDEQKKAEKKEFKKNYKDLIVKSAAVKGIRDRVINVYAGYAPLLAIVSQVVNAEGVLPLIGGQKIGQLVMVGFMACSYAMREWAKKAVKTGKYTDDQLTGLSLPLLAAASTAVMLLPYSSIGAIVTALAVAALYIGTAVPGQLDNTRMQNIVSGKIASLKKEVQADQELSAEEREAKLDKLNRQEKDWSFRAARSYSLYNTGGLIGVGFATAIAYLLSDSHVADGLLKAIQMYGENPVFTMDRLIFLVSSVILGGLAWRHRDLTKDFIKAFSTVEISESEIQAGNVNAQAFGISQTNVDANLGQLNKSIADLKKNSIDGLTSEMKLTKMLEDLVKVHNRLLAVKEISGMNTNLQGSFNDLMSIARSYREALKKNNPSIMLVNEFNKFCVALSKDGQLEELADHMTYRAEGTYKLAEENVNFEKAKDLIRHDLVQLGNRILNGTEVKENTYQLFSEYVYRAIDNLQTYMRAHEEDNARAEELIQELNGICTKLQQADTENHIFSDPKYFGPTSAKDIEHLRKTLDKVPYALSVSKN